MATTHNTIATTFNDLETLPGILSEHPNNYLVNILTTKQQHPGNHSKYPSNLIAAT